MKRGFFAAAVVVAVSAIGAAAQQAGADRVPLSDQVFTNIQVMKGVPADQFMGTMGYMSNALSVN
jgi:hypothetical protein